MLFRSGAVLIMESPSYKALRGRFPMARSRRFGSRQGFFFHPKRGAAVSAVLEGDKDRAFVIQAPTSLCPKKNWLALVRSVASRLSDSEKRP